MRRGVPLVRRASAFGALFGLGMLSGCTPMRPGALVPDAARMAALEVHLARDSSDLALLATVAAGHREAERYEEARSLLEQAVQLQPHEPAGRLLLGLTYEDLGLFSEAREQYTRYLRVGRSPQLRTQIRGRLQVIQREEWIAAARKALAVEVELAGRVPEPRTVGVFPFLFHGAEDALRPLSLALADMMVTDLAQVERLRVLERPRVQILLDEIRLAETNLVDPGTAARSGRLLGAARIVQGRVGGTEELLELEALVVGIGEALEPRVSPVSEQDPVTRLFDMQKRLVLGLFPSLGIELTPAERARILRRPTQHLQALLAYGLGLEAEDAGMFSSAADHYLRAASLDPNFTVARLRAEAAARAAVAADTPTRQLTQAALDELGAVETELAALDELIPTIGGRNAASEGLGYEWIGPRGAILRIRLRPE